MRLASLLGPDLASTLETDPDAIREALDEFHPEDVTELIEDLPEDVATLLMRVLPAELGADVMERLEPDGQERMLRALGKDKRTSVLAEMDPDDRADTFQELDDHVAARMLKELEEADPEAAEEVRELVGWGPDTAGGLMTTEYVALEPDAKVWEAIEAVRRAGQLGEAEMLDYAYACGYGGKVLGVVTLRELIVSDPGQTLSDIMTQKVLRVAPTDDQEKVADLIARYDLSAVPVVDVDGTMLGVVTVDDVVDVIIEEATEDAQKMGGVVPLEDSYFATGLGEFVWKRATWLVVLFLGQLLTATVMEQNEETLRTTLELAVFIPLIIASGGNAGAQSSTLIIRALAVGEMAPRDWLRVLVRELAIGLSIGVALGAIGFARAFFLGESIEPARIAGAVGLAILAVVTLGATIGSLLPLGIRRLGFDPAVSSTPFIASLIDVLGLLVYFALARFILTFAF